LENAALFVRLGLLPTLIRHENEAFPEECGKRQLFVCAERKHFENLNNSSSVVWIKSI